MPVLPNTPPAPFDYRPPDTDLEIIHQDGDILVLNKPSGLLSVPGKHDGHKDCLESRVQKTFPHARIVHRLDMDTSGLIIMALNAAAHRHLGLQFERRHVKKRYIALGWGRVQDDEGVVELPLICDWKHRPKQKICFDQGKSAFTFYHVLARAGLSTRLSLAPKTGRSHQLRVHMAALGHPILGDNLYAHEKALAASNRLCLHAEKLGLYHPQGGEWREFQKDCPF